MTPSVGLGGCVYCETRRKQRLNEYNGMKMTLWLPELFIVSWCHRYCPWTINWLHMIDFVIDLKIEYRSMDFIREYWPLEPTTSGLLIRPRPTLSLYGHPWAFGWHSETPWLQFPWNLWIKNWARATVAWKFRTRWNEKWYKRCWPKLGLHFQVSIITAEFFNAEWEFDRFHTSITMSACLVIPSKHAIYLCRIPIWSQSFAKLV